MAKVLKLTHNISSLILGGHTYNVTHYCILNVGYEEKEEIVFLHVSEESIYELIDTWSFYREDSYSVKPNDSFMFNERELIHLTKLDGVREQKMKIFQELYEKDRDLLSEMILRLHIETFKG